MQAGTVTEREAPSRLIKIRERPPKPNGATKRPGSAQNTAFHGKHPRKPRNAAYHARRREARDRDDQALLEAMRANPDATISVWAETIGRSRSSTVSALNRMRNAGLAESVEGKWKLTEESAPHEPAPQWIAPLSSTASRERRAHA